MQFKECNDNISIFYAMKHYTQECNSYLKTKLSNIYWCIEYQLCITEFSRSHPFFSLSLFFSPGLILFFFLTPRSMSFCLSEGMQVCSSVCLPVSLSICLCVSLYSLSLSLKLIFCYKIKIKTLWLMQMNGCFHMQCLNISCS